MKPIKDPFPRTPERFHLRVEQALSSLEERNMNKRWYSHKKMVILAAAVLAALLTATAVAVVAGSSNFKERLNAEGAAEVAGLVGEPHLTAEAADGTGFEFSVDEIIWEDHDLYVSYSMSVPEDGSYMVAMYTPTLNGEKLVYDAKGFTVPKFFDREDGYPTVLLLGGRYDADCNELWTFAVDPRLKQKTDNRLVFRAVLLKTDLDLEGGGDWTDMLNPPKCFTFAKDWRHEVSPKEIDSSDAAYVTVMDSVAAAFGDDDALTVDELISTGFAEYVTEREISMNLDGTRMAETLYNDVAEHDFDRFGVHMHVNRFRMTHLGVEIDITYFVPGSKQGDGDALRKLNDFADYNWRFCTVDGKALGYSLGGSGSGGGDSTADGAPGFNFVWHENAILPLEGLNQIAFAPCEYVDNENDNGNHPVYDLENAITLTPVYSEAVAELEANATPEPTMTPEEREAWDESSLSN